MSKNWPSSMPTTTVRSCTARNRAALSATGSAATDRELCETTSALA